MNFKKIMSAVLAGVMVASAAAGLTSCSKKNLEVPKEKRTNVYAGTELTDKLNGIEYVNNIKPVGQDLYFRYDKTETVTYNENGEEVERQPGYVDCVWDEETGLLRSDDLKEGWYYEYDYNSFIGDLNMDTGDFSEYPISMGDYNYFDTFDILDDGTMVCTINSGSYDEETDMWIEKCELFFYDIVNSEVKKQMPMNDMLQKAGLQTDYFYPNGIAAMKDGSICLGADNNIMILDQDGNFVRNVTLPNNSWIGTMIPIDDANDKLLIRAYGDNGDKIYVFENGQLNSDISDTLKQTLDNYYSPIGTANGNIYFSDGRQIAAYNTLEDKTEIAMDYVNCDIDFTSLNEMIPLSDGRFLGLFREWDDQTGESIFSVITYEKIPDEMLEEEVIVRLGCTYSDYNMARTVINFNKQNTGVRIAVISYDKYNNEENEWQGAITQLNNDIVTGNAPDIILLSAGMPVDSYFKKGIFTDLTPYMNDPEKGINRADFVENILKATQVDGKQYSIITSYTLTTLAAKTKFVGENPGWSFEDMMKAVSSMPEGMRAFFEYGRDDILENILYFGMDSLVNWDTGETKFDSPEFIEFIKFLSTCSERGFWEEYYDRQGDNYEYDPDLERELEEKSNLCYIRDEGLLDLVYIGSFTDLMNVNRRFGKDPYTLIGFPSADGNGAAICPDQEFAITQKSKVKDQAWDVLKTLMSAKDDNNRYSYSYGFTVNKADLEDRCEHASDNWWYASEEIIYDAAVSSSAPIVFSETPIEAVPVEEVQVTEAGEEIIGADIDADIPDIAIEEPVPIDPYDSYAWMRESGYSEEYIEFMQGNNVPFDQTTAEKILDLIYGATSVARQDQGLADSIQEELSSFFGGAKTAEETAKVIASRARIYISTNS